MKRPQIPSSLSFDGCGVNDKSREYAPRILTIPQGERDKPAAKATAKAAAALPQLLGALEHLHVLLNGPKPNKPGGVSRSMIREALRAAGYEF